MVVIRGLPAVLIGAGIVVGGIVIFGKASNSVGAIFVFVGVSAIVTRKIEIGGRSYY